MKYRKLMPAALGLVLIVAGLWTMKQTPVQASSWLTGLGSIVTALGCGFFGNGLGGLMEDWAFSGHPEAKERMEIEKRDERNVAVSSRAKAKAYDVMTFVFGALMVAFALMNVGLVPIVMLVSAYLFVEITAIWYHARYEKEM